MFHINPLFKVMKLQYFLFMVLIAGYLTGCGLTLRGICAAPDCATPAYGDACRVYVDSASGQANFHRSFILGTTGGISRTNPAGCYGEGQVYGLQGWRFNMPDGHKLGRIKLKQDPDSIDFEMTDGDRNDFMDGFVWLVPLPEGTQRRETTRSCRGSCTLTLDRKEDDEVFVLIGFDLNRNDDDEGHVRQISVGPISGDDTAPTIQVIFSDDAFGYQATIQYAYISDNIVDLTGRVEASYSKENNSSGTDPNLTRSTPTGNAVLQGFNFEFLNGGHFIEEIGLERHRSSYEAWFQDHQDRSDRRNPDDPFDWEAHFVILK
jgi:hypothetical protein